MNKEHGQHVRHLRDAEELAMVADLGAVIWGWRCRAAQAIWCRLEHINKHLLCLAIKRLEDAAFVQHDSAEIGCVEVL